MKAFTSAALLLLSTSSLTHAYFACTSSNAVPISALIPAGGSGGSGGVSSGTITVPNTGSCNSFWIAAGGDCTPAKSKRQSRYTTLPCLDTMTCVLGSQGALGCWDQANGDVINDDGTCGNMITGQVKEGCVEALLQDAGVSASATRTSGAAKATETVDNSGTPTTGGLNGVVSVESNNGGGVVAASGLVGVVGFVIAMLAI